MATKIRKDEIKKHLGQDLISEVFSGQEAVNSYTRQRPDHLMCFTLDNDVMRKHAVAGQQVLRKVT